MGISFFGRAIVVSALTTGLLGGCHRKTQAEAAARDGILLFGNGAEPKEIDPGTQSAEIEYTIGLALFEGLVSISQDGKTIVPGVAKTWDLSADKLTYVFHLRPDARWSDGTSVTADDFVYAFRRVFNPAVPSPNNTLGLAITGAQAMSLGKGDELGVRALDPLTLQIHLDYPTPYLLYVLAGPPFDPVPRAIVEKFGGGTSAGSQWTRPGNLVCNGPFVLTSWSENRVLVVSKSPTYWGKDKVGLNEIHFFPIDDQQAEERAFRAGQLHITYRLPTSKIPVYQKDHDSRLNITPLLATEYITINAKQAPFTDGRVRRALALALDRETLVRDTSMGSLSVAHSFVRPGTAGYTPPRPVDFDVALARKLLAEAGYPDGRGFPHVTMQASAGHDVAELEAIQLAWKRVLGIQIDLGFEEHKVFLDDLTTHRFPLAFTSYFYGIDAPETLLMIAQSDSIWNYSNLRDEAFDQAFTEANMAIDEGVRRAAYDKMEQRIQEDAVVIPFAYLDQAYLVSPLVKGWRGNSLGVVNWTELSLAK